MDGEGRYGIRLYCDSQGSPPTLRVRKAQDFSHSSGGTHCPLLPNTEVLVGFENGDPDRPVIVAAAPRPGERSPVRDDQYTDTNVLVSARRYQEYQTDPNASPHPKEVRPGVVIQVK